ncbi:hypothetical protein B0J11DRAFT_248338 [Dendryphion nanum]|uniref:Hemerythrin-like domain-containing protein n=1 Tax=Dendryphion nanum TaxID=256645 RepID=A0A9P9IT87_9PLEO|nr:hypothetical protein B0J11DRAFT_248338 [Dendryphion nanum]
MAKAWADKPFQLLAIPGTPGAATSKDSRIVAVAADMANAHNLLIRGLNSIYLQGPHVTKPADVADFAFYVTSWVDSVHHHHHGEETILFPAFEAIAKSAGDTAGVMNENVEQHKLFENGLNALKEYASKFVDLTASGDKQFDAAEMKRIIDSFGDALATHLHDEIKTLLALEKFDSKVVKKEYDDMVQKTIKGANVHVVVPLALGCADRTAVGSEGFPPIPFFLPFLCAYVFSRKHKGAWRFSPCDAWGKPQPLQFVGEN